MGLRQKPLDDGIAVCLSNYSCRETENAGGAGSVRAEKTTPHGSTVACPRDPSPHLGMVRAKRPRCELGVGKARQDRWKRFVLGPPWSNKRRQEDSRPRIPCVRDNQINSW